MGDFVEESPEKLTDTLRLLLKNLILRNVVASNYKVLFEGEIANNILETTVLGALRSMRNFHGCKRKHLHSFKIFQIFTLY